MIGESIRTWRQKNSMTQKELGERLGVRAQTVSSWETNRTEPDIGTVEALAAALHCRKTDLIGEELSQRDAVLSPEETDLLQAFRKLSRPEQIMVLRSVGVEIKKDHSESLTEAG